MKTVLVTHGGDWTDAGADLYEVPNDLNLEVANEEYRSWLTTLKDRDDWLSFTDWLKRHKGCEDSQAERFHEE